MNLNIFSGSHLVNLEKWKIVFFIRLTLVINGLNSLVSILSQPDLLYGKYNTFQNRGVKHAEFQ